MINDVNTFALELVTMQGIGYSNEQIQDRILQEIGRIVDETGYRLRRATPEEVQVFKSRLRLRESDSPDMSEATDVDFTDLLSIPVVNHPYDVRDVKSINARLRELFEQYGGNIRTLRGSVYIEEGEAAIPFRNAVPLSLKTERFSWGQVANGRIVFTGKINNLAYALWHHPRRDGRTATQISEAIFSCSQFQSTGFKLRDLAKTIGSSHKERKSKFEDQDALSEHIGRILDW